MLLQTKVMSADTSVPYQEYHDNRKDGRGFSLHKHWRSQRNSQKPWRVQVRNRHSVALEYKMGPQCQAAGADVCRGTASSFIFLSTLSTAPGSSSSSLSKGGSRLQFSHRSWRHLRHMFSVSLNGTLHWWHSHLTCVRMGRSSRRAEGGAFSASWKISSLVLQLR